MGSSNSDILSVISALSQPKATVVNPNITITNGNTISKNIPKPLSEEFTSFRAALWARHAELNPISQPVVQKSNNGVIFKR